MATGVPLGSVVFATQEPPPVLGPPPASGPPPMLDSPPTVDAPPVLDAPPIACAPPLDSGPTFEPPACVSSSPGAGSRMMMTESQAAAL